MTSLSLKKREKRKREKKFAWFPGTKDNLIPDKRKRLPQYKMNVKRPLPSHKIAGLLIV